MIMHYLDDINDALSSYEWIHFIETIRCDLEETDLKRILFYRFRVHLSDGGQLEIVERLVESKEDGEFSSTKYSFHWQDHAGTIIKRWDNAPHFSGLDGFPHHIHIGTEDHVISGRPINGLQILDEINQEFFHANKKNKK
ncbi:MAG: toxin-antitoxin system TumE family protein [Desulfobacteria bacterium]